MSTDRHGYGAETHAYLDTHYSVICILRLLQLTVFSSVGFLPVSTDRHGYGTEEVDYRTGGTAELWLSARR